MKFYTSDLHLDHKRIIEYEDRPYYDIEDMNQDIIRRWNKKVGPDDEVYILGDFCFDNKGPRTMNFLNQLNGKKYLIVGNHDAFLSSKNFDRSLFEWIKNYAEIYDGEDFVCLFHYPIAVWNKKHHGAYHLYGHIHKNTGNSGHHPLEFNLGDHAFNVGVDVRNFEPKTLKELIKEGNKR